MPAPPWVWPPALSSISTAILDAIYARLDGTNQPFTNDIAITPGSLEIDAVDSALSALEIAHTWNNGAFVYESIRANITNTASAAGSLLLDLLVGGVQRFVISKSGLVTIAAATATVAADIPLTIAQTWNNAGIQFTGIKLAVTNTASLATSFLMDLQVGGVSKFNVSRAGGISLNNPGAAVSGQIVFPNGQTFSEGGGTMTWLLGQGDAIIQHQARGGGSFRTLKIQGGADTGRDASTELNNLLVDFNVTEQWATGALATQREVLIKAPTYAFVGASTITNAATFAIDKAPSAGTNATITNAYALWIQAGVSRFESKLSFDSTVTAGGTTGNQTINKPTGTVNFAAAATTLTVTNSLVTANSIVLCVVRTDDATAALKSVVPAAGSFLITLTAAATAETSVGFLVLN